MMLCSQSDYDFLFKNNKHAGIVPNPHLTDTTEWFIADDKSVFAELPRNLTQEDLDIQIEQLLEK